MRLFPTGYKLGAPFTGFSGRSDAGARSHTLRILHAISVGNGDTFQLVETWLLWLLWLLGLRRDAEDEAGGDTENREVIQT